MKKFERSSGARLWQMVTRLLVLVGLAALVWAAWQLLSPRFAYSDQLSLAIEGPDSISPGDSATFTVRYRNPGSAPIANATLGFHYPKGFVFTSSTPSVLGERPSVALGTIPAQSSGAVLISGRLLTDFNTTSTLTAVLSYKPSNFNSVFEKVATFETVANVSAADIEWTGPTAITSNSNTALSFTVKPNRTLEGPVTIVVDAGTGFSHQASEPKPDSADVLRWALPELKGPATFTINGSFSEGNPSPRVVIKVLGKSFTYASTEIPLELGAPGAQVSVTAASSNTQAKIKPGETLPVRLTFKENADVEAGKSITSVVLYVDAPSYQNKSILDWNKLTDKYNGEVKGEQINEAVRRAIITWDSDKINAERAFEIAVPVKDGSGGSASLVNFATSTITVWGEVRHDNEVLATSNKVIITVVSDVSLNASATDNGDRRDFVFLLTNSFHDLKNVKITADIYGDVTLDDNTWAVPAGKVDFNPTTKRLIWTIADMPSSLDSLDLQFGVKVKKANSTQTEYTSPISVTATDAETGDAISFTVDPIKAL